MATSLRSCEEDAGGISLRSMRKSRRRRFAVTLLISIALVSFVGCTSVVRPPTSVRDPQEVALVYDARHRGLILPREDGTWVEYGFGEYAWYAELRDAWYRVFPTMLWPTGGTLGRRELGAGPPVASLPWAKLETIFVERALAMQLRQSLDERFAARSEALVHNAVYRFDFVPDDDGYWCLFNCSDAVAGWLRQLDCRVSWVPIRFDLAVARPR